MAENQDQDQDPRQIQEQESELQLRPELGHQQEQRQLSGGEDDIAGELLKFHYKPSFRSSRAVESAAMRLSPASVQPVRDGSRSHQMGSGSQKLVPTSEAVTADLFLPEAMAEVEMVADDAHAEMSMEKSGSSTKPRNWSCTAHGPATAATTATGEGYDCGICLQTLGSQNSLKTESGHSDLPASGPQQPAPTQAALDGCPHMFCLSCIHKWMRVKPSCPTCRAPVSKLKLLNSEGKEIKGLELSISHVIPDEEEMEDGPSAYSDRDEGSDSETDSEYEDDGFVVPDNYIEFDNVEDTETDSGERLVETSDRDHTFTGTATDSQGNRRSLRQAGEHHGSAANRRLAQALRELSERRNQRTSTWQRLDEAGVGIAIDADYSTSVENSGIVSDSNADHCERCGEGGELICCDSCPRAFHEFCLGVSAAALPDPWNCPQCQTRSTEGTKTIPSVTLQPIQRTETEQRQSTPEPTPSIETPETVRFTGPSLFGPSNVRNRPSAPADGAAECEPPRKRPMPAFIARRSPFQGN